jgi:hypothetical protein
MTFDITWKTRLVLLVPASLYAIHTSTEFGQAIGLVSREPTDLSGVIEAPRDQVFDLLVEAAEGSSRDCSPDCSTSGHRTDEASSGRRIIRLDRPSHMSMRMIGTEGAQGLTINFILHEDGQKTRVTSTVTLEKERDLRVKNKIEGEYEQWGRQAFDGLLHGLRADLMRKNSTGALYQ